MRILALGCILALALAGCGGKSTDSDNTSDPIVTSGIVSSRVTGADGNNPPTGSLAPSTVAGAVPLTVNFTFDGSDQDKDPLTWTFDANDDGKSDQSGSTLPSSFAYTYMTTGLFNATLVITDTKADFTLSKIIEVRAPADGGVPFFTDDAEGDASKWVITSELVINPNLAGDPVPSGQPHPSGPWRQVTDQFHAGAQSWHAHYPDNYVSAMTIAAPLEIPPGGALVSFWTKGGAEDNGADGLFVNAGPAADQMENIIYQAAAIPEWKQFYFEAEPGPLVFQFVFMSDISCSSEPAPVGGADGIACGPGWDLGGFWVDDIQVA